MTESEIADLRHALSQKVVGSSERAVARRELLISAVQAHVIGGLNSWSHLGPRLKGTPASYLQALSEVLVGKWLVDAGLRPTSASKNKGPDFRIEIAGRTIWIEVTCPEPSEPLVDWGDCFSKDPDVATDPPPEKLLLRWTAAFEAKAKKLLGEPEKAPGEKWDKGYLRKGWVQANDAYVVAINGRLLRGPVPPQLTGSSQLPFAVEIAYGVGLPVLRIDRTSLHIIDASHQHRPHVLNRNRSQVQTKVFLDDRFTSISAIWAMDVDELSLERPGEIAVVHNRLANSKVPPGLLPARDEYFANSDAPDFSDLELTRVAGRFRD